MITDPVYEGKSMAGLIDLVTTGEIPKDATVLYAHLGGQPAINAYASLFSQTCAGRPGDEDQVVPGNGDHAPRALPGGAS